MNLTRREFIKIIGVGTFYFLSGCITNPDIKVTASGQMKTFSISLIHSPGDSDNGKEFVIPDFPINSIIKEIRIKSNFTSGKQNWRVAFVNKDIIPDDTNISCRTAEIFESGDYIFIGDEIANVLSSDPQNNIISVKRGVKGSIPMSHHKDTRIETANNGLRLILSSTIDKKIIDSLIMENIMTWGGNAESFILQNDKNILLNQIDNLKKYDIIYINDGSNSERVAIIGINNNELYVKDPLHNHIILREVQKQIIFDTPIIYSGIDTNLYGTLYIDEKINNDVFIDIDIVTI